jgi:hypothetical protein
LAIHGPSRKTRFILPRLNLKLFRQRESDKVNLPTFTAQPL